MDRFYNAAYGRRVVEPMRGQGYAGTFSQVLIFVLMAVVIMVRPAGLFGRKEAV